MIMEFGQQQKISRQLVMTPQLQMAIKFLQFSRLELIEQIHEEIKDNPLLEEFPDDLLDTEGNDNISGELEITWDALEPITDKFSGSQLGNPGLENPDGNFAFEESLSEHLLRQLILVSTTDEEKEIGSFIIGNLSKEGYLKLSLNHISEQTGYGIEIIKKTLKMLQSMDPAGICARNLEECLLIQARRTDVECSLIKKIISNSLIALKNKNYNLIASSLGVGLKKIHSAVTIISSFDPRPGLRFSYDTTKYIVPDIYIHRNDGNFSISLNSDGLPKIRINSEYEKIILNNKVDILAKEYLRNKMNSAIWMVKSIHQRQKTIYKVMKSILCLQKDFFYKGSDYLKPMVLKDVSNNIGMHESTVSRITNNKYVSTQRGIFELKYFFGRPIKCLKGGFVASISVQKKIRNMIETENFSKPYSDSKISEILKLEHIDIARRTVAKYREMMGIMPSNMRKQF